MSSAELAQADGRRIALVLICNHEGYVTPYGVVYDNGMKLEQLYDGRHFPSYYCDTPVLALEAISDKNGATGILSLPMSECQLTRLMQRAEIERPDVYFMVSEDSLPEKVSDALDLERLTDEDIAGLNRLCQAVEFFDDYDREKLNAAVLLTETSGIESLCRLAENIDKFDFVPNVHTAEEYGRFIIQRSGRFGYDKNLEGFYDYAKYGAQRVQEEGGQFNDCGYVAYKGEIPLEELMLHGSQQQAPEMGMPC